MDNCRCLSPSLWKRPTQKTFDRLVTLDFYDGTITAVCRCVDCGQKLLVSVIAWEPTVSSIHVFGVARISEEQYQNAHRVIEARQSIYRRGEKPKDSDFEEMISGLLFSAAPAFALVAARQIEKEILAAIDVSDTFVAMPEPVDSFGPGTLYYWLEQMGLRPSAPPS